MPELMEMVEKSKSFREAWKRHVEGNSFYDLDTMNQPEVDSYRFVFCSGYIASMKNKDKILQDFMKATDARKLTEKSKPRNDDIYDAIRKAAEDAESSIRFDLDDRRARFVKDIMTELTEAGYEVKREHGSDQRDNDSWHYLIISW